MRAGDVQKAQELQHRANEVIDVLIEVGVFPGTKAMLALLGVDCGACRAPFAPLTAAQQQKVVRITDSHLRPLHEAAARPA
jgi:N-acetylneuraminate lyase